MKPILALFLGLVLSVPVSAAEQKPVVVVLTSHAQMGDMGQPDFFSVS